MTRPIPEPPASGPRIGPTADAARRVASLTLEQKVDLLTGADFWSLRAQPEIGLRSIVVSDGPAGVRGTGWDERDPSANVPSPTALAATWDVERVAALGRLLAAECHRKHVDVLLAPTVNLQRSPYAGRHFEMWSEDPLLTGVLAAGYVRGLQSGGVGATVKHFVANDSETDRYFADMVVDERTLRELYLAPFEQVVTEAGVWAVMAAYNSTNGTTMTESPLLREVLQGEWGFDGLTMTDWFAGRSTVPAANGGLDLMMPGPGGAWGPALCAAVRDGRVPEDAVDDKVLRLLRLAGRVGALRPRTNGFRRALAGASVRDDLRAAAAAGFVLVRNAAPPGTARPLLPLAVTELRTVAVVGPNAAVGRTFGGGSALVFPPYVISPLAGLRAALGPSVVVVHAPGVRAHSRMSIADPALLMRPSSAQPGVEVEFLSAEGEVLGRETRLGASYNWQGVAGDVDLRRLGAVRLCTRLRADEPGTYLVGASGLGRFALFVDDVPQFAESLALPEGADPAEGLMRPPQHGHELVLDAGQVVGLELWYEPAGSSASFDAAMVAFQLNVERPFPTGDDGIREAAQLAAACDVAVVVVGTTEEDESEGFDRETLALSGRQDELVRRVAAANPRTVVVVNAGSPVLMPWRDEVAAVLLTWFPGQEFGSALADVLTGAVEPGGRLPTTWPADEEVPLPSTSPINGRLVYGEGLHIGHRWFERADVEPAYWFGHGLGYTDWSYGEVRVSARAYGAADVVVRLTNTGPRPGRQVVQVYACHPRTTIERPARWLAGFTAVDAAPGEEVAVEVEIRPRAFEHWDPTSGQWRVEAGTFELLVARSAGDVVARIPFEPVTTRAPSGVG